MVRFCKVIINGTTIKDDSSVSDPSKVLNWEYDKDDDDPISEAVISCKNDVTDLITLTNNVNVQIYASEDNITYNRIFYGLVDNINSEGAVITFNCRNQLYDLVRMNVNNIYDSSVDAFGGVISEIAEDLIQTYGGLTADVQDSGTERLLEVFKCVNTDIYERIKTLADSLDWILFWDDENLTVHFEPRAFTESGITLTTSDNIVNIPNWDIDTSHMINRLRVDGATTQTLITESGQIGTTSGYTNDYILLTKTPDNAEVFMDAVDPPTTQLTGGSKDGTTSSDYWIDRENKKIKPSSTFTTDDYAIVNYYWSSPAPIEMEASKSIGLYGLYEKTISLSDVASVADAEARAINILAKRSLPFYVGKFLVKSSEDLEIGMLVNVQDNINATAPNGEYMVSKIKYKYPGAFNEVQVGDKIWRMADWQENTETRLKRLEEQFVRNQDLLRKLVQATQEKDQNLLSPVPVYRKILTRDVDGDGIWGRDNWGANYWRGGYTYSEETYWVAQYEDTYTETFVDDDFEDTSGTATWGSGTLVFP